MQAVWCDVDFYCFFFHCYIKGLLQFEVCDIAMINYSEKMHPNVSSELLQSCYDQVSGKDGP